MAENEAKGLIRAAVWLMLYLLPVFYASQILAVVIHEILGHGLAAAALGGRFDGFALKWDGMGWAFASLPPAASEMEMIVMLFSGVLATITAGLLFLVLAYVFRKAITVRLAMLVGAVACLMEGIPYIFWNSYHPVPPGDIGRILLLSCDGNSPEGSMPQIVLLVASGAMFVAGTFYLCALMFQGIEQALVGGERLRPVARFWVLLLFLTIPGGAGWFLFDWNQLAPGIGILPCVAGAVSILLSTIVLYRYSLPLNTDLPKLTPDKCTLMVSWGLLLVVVIPTILWFGNGVKWR